MSEQGRKIPTGRIDRLARLGLWGVGTAGSAALRGAGAAVTGRSTDWTDLVMTPDALASLGRELARLRGAALKVGQMLSMDAGEVLPPELAELTDRLRDGAEPMAPRQLRRVLDQSWGQNWLRQFSRFNTKPAASASIGQVHRAILKDGRAVAVKVQYPGVRDSIDSDIANVGGLIKMSGLLPKGFEIAPLLEEARVQLHDEADYAREASLLAAYADALGEDERFTIPTVHDDRSTETILVMDWLPGGGIERAAEQDAAERARVYEAFLDLTLKELFELGVMQTDPNFANFLYDGPGKPLGLIDFGATRPVAPDISARYRAVFAAGLTGDAAALGEALIGLGVMAEDTPKPLQDAMVEISDLSFEAIRSGGAFSFADRSFTTQIRERAMTLRKNGFNHAPPPDLLFIQRKLAGAYLLGARLDVKMDLRRRLERALA